MLWLSAILLSRFAQTIVEINYVLALLYGVTLKQSVML